ncbi:MAG TPA: PAS domain-containing protein [Bryobacteraceae bacterium]|nr:PAS domain-containing protein [Bryobacteraceae bacterium]
MLEVLDPNRYRTILESLPNGVYVVDRDRKILFWNDGAEQITGYLRQEVIGRYCPDNLLMHCDENYRYLCGSQCPLLHTIHDGRVRDVQVFLRHKNGERVPVRVRAVPLRDADGSIIGAIETFDEVHPWANLRIHPNARAVENHVEQLTGISDHDSTRSYLEACLRDYAADQIPFSILQIAIDDLDRFRKIHGAVATNRIVHMVAATLSKNLREGDIAGHWAGDCFLAILLDCQPASLDQIAAKLKVIIEYAAIPWWGEWLSVAITASGTTVRAADTVDSLLARCGETLVCLEDATTAGNRPEEGLE